jgi:hypothetical protein
VNERTHVKIAIPTWFGTKPTTTADCETQLAAAQADVASLKTAHATAEATYAEERTVAAENAVLDLETSLKRAEKRLELAKQDLDAAKQRDAEAARKALLDRKAELVAKLSNTAVAALQAPSLDAFVDALSAAADAHAERVAAEHAVGAIERELHRVQAELGESPITSFRDARPSDHAVAERLMALMQSGDDSRRAFVQRLLSLFGGAPRMHVAQPTKGVA